MARWRIILLLSLFVFAALAAVMISAVVEKKRESTKAVACWGDLTEIGTAMRNYHEKYGHFPPAYTLDGDGKPAHSWRVLLLEFLDHRTFTEYRFDEPWDGPNNQKLAHRMPACYRCPATSNSHRWETNYFVVVGQDTAFPGSRTMKLSDIERPHGDTILVVEADGLGVNWMEPRDLMFDTMSFELNDKALPSMSSNHKKGVGYCTAEGSVLWLEGMQSNRLREMLLIRKPSGQ